MKENELPAVVQAMRQRLDREATRSQAETLWTATYLLMGLTYSDELIDRLLEGVQSMKESVTYQKILREGRARKRRKSLSDWEANDLESPTPTSRPQSMPSRIWSDSSSCPTEFSR